MANRRLIFPGALLLLLAICVLWVRSLPPRAPRQSISFPGGSRITFAGTTYGKAALPPTGSWTRNFAFLPDSLLRVLKINPGRRVTLQWNHLAVWFFSTAPASMGSFPFPGTTFSLMDEKASNVFLRIFLLPSLLIKRRMAPRCGALIWAHFPSAAK